MTDHSVFYSIFNEHYLVYYTILYEKSYNKIQYMKQ